jgi:AcrR family transcriptional regulator
MTHTDRILAGSLELFLKAGIKSVTMDDIARQIGMSKKTIYQYFKDKDDLVNALVSKQLREDKDNLCAIIEEPGNVIEQMIGMMKHSEEFLGRINPVFIHDLQKYHPEAWKQFMVFKKDVLVTTIENLLTVGKKEDYIRADIDVKVMARMRVSQIEMGFNAELFPISEFSPWHVQYQFMEHFTYGVCTTKGRKVLDKYKNIIEQE